MRKGNFRFNITYCENNKPFTVIITDKDIPIHKDFEIEGKKVYRIFDLQNPLVERNSLAEKNEGKYSYTYIIDEIIPDDIRTGFIKKHFKTKITFIDIVPEIITKVYDISYSHKTHMTNYSLLRKEDKWFYLFPYKLEEERLIRILKDSSNFKNSYKNKTIVKHDEFA